MITADGVEITADMDLWDIDGRRHEPAAINTIDPDPENWAWQHVDKCGLSSTVWPHRTEGPWLSSHHVYLVLRRERKLGQIDLVRRLMRLMTKKGKWDHAEVLQGLASDLLGETFRIEDEIRETGETD